MTRIDSATITLDVWDEANGVRKSVTFAVPLDRMLTITDGRFASARDIMRAWWDEHADRIRLAAKDDAGGFGPLGV